MPAPTSPGPSVDRPPLRIGLLLDTAVCQRFAADIIATIVRSDFARLELVVTNALAAGTGDAPPGWRAPLPVRLGRTLLHAPTRRLLLYEAYLRADAKRFRPDDDPLAPVDCGPLLAGVEAIEVRPEVKGFAHSFPPEALAAIRSRRLDVLLRFGFNILRGGILDAARCGVWSLHHGDMESYRGGPPHFWEIVEGNPISGVTLQILTEELDAGVVLGKALFATVPGLSVARNRYAPYRASASLVIRKLRELQAHGWERVRSRARPPERYLGRRRVYKRPTNVEMARWLLPAVAKKAARRLLRSPGRPHWRMALRVGGTPLPGQERRPDLRGFSWIDSPPGHYYADPFLLSRNGRRWVFFEDFSHATSRGVIACAEIAPGGSLGPARTCLARDYHLSYPMVFEHEGDAFMVPETRSNGTVELYRATRFPSEWRLEKVLRRMDAVDTTVLHEAGRFWFFVGVSDPPGHCATLLLFHADALTGEWIPHPDNPISSDVRNARGAGAILRSQGRRYRPSQDCARGYGYSFTLNEIATLTPDRYREEPRVTVEPASFAGVIATHTYNRCGDIEIIDGCSMVPTSSVRQPRRTSPA